MARASYRAFLRFERIDGFALALLWLMLTTGVPAHSILAAERPATSANASGDGKNEFDLDALAERLRASTSIGFLTKLSLRNQIDDLIEDFRRFHAGKRDRLLPELRDSFNFLIMKITSLVQDNEPELAKDVFNAREVLWAKLTDPKEFSKI